MRCEKSVEEPGKVFLNLKMGHMPGLTLSIWVLLACEAWSHCSHLGCMRTRILNKPMFEDDRNKKLLVTVFYKSNPPLPNL